MPDRLKHVCDSFAQVIRMTWGVRIAVFILVAAASVVTWGGTKAYYARELAIKDGTIDMQEKRISAFESGASLEPTKGTARELSNEQKDKLVSILLPTEKIGPITVANMVSDPETFQYAKGWEEVFKRAGWVVNREQSWFIVPPAGQPPAQGILMQVHDAEEGALTGAGDIQKTLQKMGIELTAQVNKDIKPGEIKFYVAARPQ